MKLSRFEPYHQSISKQTNLLTLMVLLWMVAPLARASESEGIFHRVDVAALKQSFPVDYVTQSSHGPEEPLACPARDEPFTEFHSWQTERDGNTHLRIIAVSRNTEEPLVLKVFGSDQGEIPASYTDSFGHYPRATRADFNNMLPGRFTAALLLQNSGRVLACLEFSVAGPAVGALPPSPPASGIWNVSADWSPAMEDLFSVFIARLFYVPPGIHKGWKDMQTVVYNPERNILYGLLGWNEDNPAADVHVKLRPDCADAPYQLRAYFSWKMGLPYKFHICTRGSSKRGARCPRSFSHQVSQFDDVTHPVNRFNAFAKQYIVWRVHAGNPRTRPEMNNSDFYSVAIDEQSIRPGTVFVDDGGHVILVTQWSPQKDIYLGELYGVDAHPDRTVTHKRFAPGTFIFNHKIPTDGFKAFRPVVRTEEGTRFLSNAEINDQPGFVPQSDAQSHYESKSAFYDGVFSLLNPSPVNPTDVLEAKIQVLHSAMKERVLAVDVGFEFMNAKNWPLIPMPSGSAIFQTEGSWETYSTPARDLRVFIALDDAVHFPTRVVQNPGAYGSEHQGSQEELLQTLESLRDEALEKKKISYTRSDGSKWTLSLLDIVQRGQALEMSYNPNDCPEIRWAAPPDSEEITTCLRTAPKHQTKRMLALRPWFSKRKRPDQ